MPLCVSVSVESASGSIVAKVENRKHPKNLAKVDLWILSYCFAFQRRYGGSVLDLGEAILWSLTSTRVRTHQWL